MAAACSRGCSRRSTPEARYFVIASAIIYALILVGHVARVAAEGTHTLTEPLFLVSSVLAVGMTGWALYLLVRRR